MKFIKSIWKNLSSRVWLIVTPIVIVLFLVANILTMGPLYSLVCIPLGSRRAMYAEGVEAVYPTSTNDKNAAKEQGARLTREIAGEGIVLLKNENGALPLERNARISVFGKNSVDIVFGGSGSGGGDSSQSSTLYDGLEEAGFRCNPTLKSFYEDSRRSGDPRDENPKIENNGNSSIQVTETPYSSYVSNNIPESYAEYSDAALIVISRIGGEGFDLPRQVNGDESRHYLELSANEEEMIREVCKAFEKVILVVNSANAMELGFVEDGSLGDIDACLTLPGPGSTGTLAFGDILNGTVNPSGHTADTFVADLRKDPTWFNFGDNNVTDGDRYDTSAIEAYFVDYEEGVYVGYRYYETRYASYAGAITAIGEDAALQTADEWYESAVVYPFGFGLSYTSFEWETDVSALDNVQIAADGSYEIKVTVTNTGDQAGKDVIQLYASAPYTDGGIEKPHKVLCGFVKTGLIRAGGHEEYTITVNPYDFASYDYSDANGNGFKGYELEAGNYTLYISHNAHESEEAVSFSVPSGGIRYENDPVTGNKVENRYDDADDHLNAGGTAGGTLSRKDWSGTWPTTPLTAEDRGIDDATIAAIRDTSTNNPTDYSSAQMPTTGAEYTVVDEETGETELAPITLRDMNGVAYDDEEKWNEFLDQLLPSEMVTIYNEAAFQTLSVMRESISVIPFTKESDGPVGFCNFMSDRNIYGTNAYTCEVMIAQTWNIELAEEMGRCLGEEGKWGDIEGRVSGVPYSGLYAPGANIHRSAFGGRNFEYFSEDSFLTGMMAAYEIKGGQEEGIFMTMKHFALNEQETHRSTGMGSISWVTEQAMREIYLKPFEMAVKIADNHAIMSSFNRIGARWAGGDYRLLTEILRNEWGFEGLVICDFNTNSYMNTRQEIYAGGDLNLSGNRFWNTFDSNSAADVTVVRNAMHHVMYVLANTNAINGEIIGYKMPYWQIALIAADVVVAVGLAVWGVFAIRKAVRKDGEETIIIE